MNNSLISVIVPVYNTEKYLRRCIDSVLAQTYTDFELLLIDDGSKDSSGTICDEYAAQDARVRVFHKENGGVSSARNLGLDNAQGEWITFVDSDDYIEENFLKSFERKLDADIVIGNAVVLKSHIGTKIHLKYIPLGFYFDIRQILCDHMQELNLRSPWGKLYRTNIISDLKFNESIHLGEDTLFNLCCFQRITSISVLGDENARSSYVYRDFDNYCKKYEMSVYVSVYNLTTIISVYESLNIRCRHFEDFITNFYYQICSKDMLVHGSLWYGNKIIREFMLRHFARMGIFPWIKTWLMFHGFYRLKIFLMKRRTKEERL